MHAFTAADSVTLAIQRTRDFLFRPFNWGIYLKLGLVAIITEGIGSNLNSSSKRNHPSGNGLGGLPPLHLTPERIAMAVASIALVVVVLLMVYYLVTRLRFAYFHCLVHNSKEIRPGWHIYREPAGRFFRLNVIVGLCYVLLAGLVLLPFATGLWRLFRAIPPGGHPDIALLISLLLPMLPLVLFLALTGIVADVVLRDWMLPHYALDNATAGEAWKAVRTSINAEAKQFFVYALLRLVLPTVAMAILFILLIIPGLAVAGVVWAIEYGIHSAFAGATGGAALTGQILHGFFGAAALCLLAFASICLGGPLATGIRQYAITFYGGRYAVLGDILYPPVSQLPPQTRASRFA